MPIVQDAVDREDELSGRSSSPLAHKSSVGSGSHTSGPHSSKRSRTTSKPSASSTSSLNFDLHSARQASSQRLLDVWSQLALRYSRPINEDDIVDIRTNKVIKDRGVLRAVSAQKLEFGLLSARDEQPAGSRVESSVAEEDVEQGVSDEIDFIPPEIDGPKAHGIRLSSVPPVAVVDPADAADLREFLEHERRRKEALGDEGEGEDDEDEDEDEVEVVELLHDDAAGSGVERESDWVTEASEKEYLHSQHLHESSSEDELGFWDDDESSRVYLVDGDSDSEVDALNDLPPPSSSPTPSDTCLLSSPVRSSNSVASPATVKPQKRTYTALGSRPLGTTKKLDEPSISDGDAPEPEVIPARSSKKSLQSHHSAAVLTSRSPKPNKGRNVKKALQRQLGHPTSERNRSSSPPNHKMATRRLPQAGSLVSSSDSDIEFLTPIIKLESTKPSLKSSRSQPRQPSNPRVSSGRKRKRIPSYAYSGSDAEPVVTPARRPVWRPPSNDDLIDGHVLHERRPSTPTEDGPSLLPQSVQSLTIASASKHRKPSPPFDPFRDSLPPSSPPPPSSSPGPSSSPRSSSD